jgi:hypothetical protein
MRFQLIMAAALVLGMFSITEAPCQAPDVHSEVKEASSVLLGSSASPDRIVQALVQLIDCASFLSRESEYAEEIANQLNIAKEEFQKNSFFSEKGRQKLSFAFRMLTNGLKYEPPKELDDFVTPQEATVKAREYAENLVKQALENHRQGDHLLAARKLVELVLIIVTPIEGSAGGAS